MSCLADKLYKDIYTTAANTLFTARYINKIFFFGFKKNHQRSNTKDDFVEYLRNEWGNYSKVQRVHYRELFPYHEYLAS